MVYKTDIIIKSRIEACKFLGIRIDASSQEIKNAYRALAKKYHPDANPGEDTKEQYIVIKKAYEFLMNCHEDEGSNIVYYNPKPAKREAKVFQTDSNIRRQHERQKQMEAERKRAKEWAESHRKKDIVRPDFNKNDNTYTAKSQEEEILEKIRAIWLAETIRRQIELDKEKKEAENKKKLYRAFMQQRIHEEEAAREERINKNLDGED